MPPKKDATKSSTSDGKSPPSKNAGRNTSVYSNVSGKEDRAQIGAAANGGARKSDFSSLPTAVQKVRQIADKLQTAVGNDAKVLSDVVVERLRDHEFLDPAKLKDVETFVKSSKGSVVGQLIDELKAIRFEDP